MVSQDAVSDSHKIYKPFVKSIASSLLSAIVDLTSFMLLVHVGNSVFPATAMARVTSGILNFSLNKIWVFGKKDSHNTRNESLKYLALFTTQMVFSGLLTEALSNVLNLHNSLVLSKMLADCSLFVANFIVQRSWVFSSRLIMDSKMKNKHAFAIFYTTILIIATVWSLLDTFVIADKIAVVDETLANTSVYADLESERSSGSSSDSDPDEYSSSTNSDSALDEYPSSSDSDSALGGDSDGSTEAPVITDHSYQDSNIQITIETIREYNTDIYVADVVISDVAYLKTALAQNTYGRNIKETTSDMADERDAILAINGDYYGFRKAGFVIRNGVLYQATARSGTAEALVVHAHGGFEIIDEGSSDAQALYDEGALQVFTFGPGLVRDGEVSVTSRSEVSQSKSSNPRTAIGMIDKLHYIFVVSDGRTSESAGLSLVQLAEVMQAYGCTEAYNLDGGGSSTMVFNGVVINNPTDGHSYGERKVSDIIYIGGSL
jgi:exopolysaccharide biosynthesis protein/putative flippase GtrA